MPKFRKKPVVVDAEQWFPGKHIDGLMDSRDNSTVAYIDTLEGRMVVRSGDWIITGIKDERYPCKPDIFEMTYEPA